MRGLLRTSQVLALLLGSSACKSTEEAPSSDPLALVPTELHGVYGRTAEDAPGLIVSETGLEFRAMKLVIHAGTMEGDSVRVERATLSWPDVEPKTCTGTIAAQGERLLLNLFEIGGSQERCEAILDGNWSRWQAHAELPESIRGRYGNLLVERQGMRLDIEWVTTTMTTPSIYELPAAGEGVELLIPEATFIDPTGVIGDFQCSGTMKLQEGQLSTSFWVPARLVPTIGSPQDEDPAVQAKLAENTTNCERWTGSATKWSVDTSDLPKAKLAKPLVTLEVGASEVVLDAPYLRCKLPLWRTESVPTDAIGNPAAGAKLMTLGKAEPERIEEGCRLKIRIWCERAAGNAVESLDPASAPDEAVSDCIDDQTRDICPDSLYLRSISDVRWKLGAGPDVFNEIACVDTTGEFRVEKP